MLLYLSSHFQCNSLKLKFTEIMYTASQQCTYYSVKESARVKDDMHKNTLSQYYYYHYIIIIKTVELTLSVNSRAHSVLH